MYNLISIESNQSSSTTTTDSSNASQQPAKQCGCKKRMRDREQDIDRMMKHGNIINMLTIAFWLLACIYLFILITRKTQA